MIKSISNFFLFQPLSKLLLLPNTSSNYVVKFAIYHPHYKNKLIGNLTQTFICTANYLYFLYSLVNFLIASLFTCNDDIYTPQLGQVAKKEKPPRTPLIHMTDIQIKLMSEVSFNFSYVPPKVEFLLDIINLLNKQLQQKIINKF